MGNKVEGATREFRQYVVVSHTNGSNFKVEDTDNWLEATRIRDNMLRAGVHKVVITEKVPIEIVRADGQ